VVTGTDLDTGLGSDLDTGVGTEIDTGIDTGIGIGTAVDVTQTPDLGEDLDTGVGIDTTTTPDTIPTEIPEGTPRTDIPDYPGRPPRIPDPDIRFDDPEDGFDSVAGFEEESDTFESGIVDNPFEDTE
jgi:hypothetical protein